MKHDTTHNKSELFRTQSSEDALDRMNWRSMTVKGDTGPVVRQPHHEQPEHPITEPEDPRWVLALQAQSLLEGGRVAAIAPEKRERLVRWGKTLGIRPFDVQLIIAIVQDNARQGYDTLAHDASHRLACVNKVPTQSVRSFQIVMMLLASLTLGIIAAAMFVVWMTR